MGKHSPKPWKSNGNDIIDADDMVVCSFGKHSNVFTGEEIEEMNANAQLIAAVPDLLEECEKMLNEIVVLMEDCNERDKYAAQKKRNKLHKSVINKAKGADD